MDHGQHFVRARYAGWKSPGVHLNPIDAPAGSSRREGAHVPILNCHAVINMAPIRSLQFLAIHYQAKRQKALDSSVTFG